MIKPYDAAIILHRQNRKEVLKQKADDPDINRAERADGR